MVVADRIVCTPGSGGRVASVNGAVLPSGMGGDLGVEWWFRVLKDTLFGFCSQACKPATAILAFLRQPGGHQPVHAHSLLGGSNG